MNLDEYCKNKIEQQSKKCNCPKSGSYIGHICRAAQGYQFTPNLKCNCHCHEDKITVCPECGGFLG
jgi:hypothetical protein